MLNRGGACTAGRSWRRACLQQIVWEGMKREGVAQRTWCHSQPDEPDGEGIDGTFCGPPVAPLPVLPKTRAHKLVEDGIEACPVELGGVLAVIFGAHDEGGPEVCGEVIGVDVGGAETLEGDGALLELPGLVGGVGCTDAHAALGGAPVEFAAEDAGIEVETVVEREGGVESFAGHQEGDEVGRGTECIEESDLEGDDGEDVGGYGGEGEGRVWTHGGGKGRGRGRRRGNCYV